MSSEQGNGNWEEQFFNKMGKLFRGKIMRLTTEEMRNKRQRM